MDETKDVIKAFAQSCFDFVVNNKKEVKNEDVDKRKLIDEVAGMMKSAGCDDEVIRTAIGKMEKIGYDKSSAGTANNEEEEEEVTEEKKEDVKEEREEKAENKCNNSKDVDYMEEMAKVSKEVANEAKQPVEFETRQQKLQTAIDYFKM